MTSKHIATLLVCLFLGGELYAQTSIKTMFYNLLRYPSGNPQNRELLLKDIIQDYQPDLFTVCELESQEGATEILTKSLQSLNANYSSATFVSNQSDDGVYNQLQQLLFYDSSKFELVNEQVHTTNVRDINQYTLLLNTIDKETNPLYLEYFVAHFKSSTGSTNKAIRLDMAEVFTNVINTLSSDCYVLFAGDFNLYTSTEDAYHEILDDANNIVMVDPENPTKASQSWNNNATYQGIHTQATRVNQQYSNGAYSGMDDRFDFIFVSENLTSSGDLQYSANTYSAYGNNKNCYNRDVKDVSCTGTYSQDIRNTLFDMSDHLPVVLELETTRTILGLEDVQLTKKLRLNGSNLIANSISLLIEPELYNSKLTIYNHLGRVIYTVPTTTNPLITINVNHLAEGIYMITSNKALHSSIKFIKTH
ncbi:hypothetical protein KH5_00790 [Urechidicola sp. KH5]